MQPFIIVLAAIWVYPVLSLFVMLSVKEKPKARKVILIFSGSIAAIGFAGMISGYSTVNENIDWFFVTSIYLFISLVIWGIIFQPNRWIKVLGLMLMILTFGFGYISGSAGILGLAFQMGEYQHHGKIKISENLSYTESVLGNATSDYRGKRIEIFKNPSSLPFLERMIFQKSYLDIPQFSTPATVVYKADENKVYFSIRPVRKSRYKLDGWADTVDLNLY